MNVRITEHVRKSRENNKKSDRETFPDGCFNPYKDNVGIMANYHKGTPSIHNRPVDWGTGFTAHKGSKRGKS